MLKYVGILILVVTLIVVPTKVSHAFSDVPNGAYYEEAVKWAVAENIVSGYPDNTFKPNNKVTFNHFVKMYTNTYDFKKNQANTYEDFYKVLANYGLLFNTAATYGNITRGDVSVLLAYAAGNVPNYEAYDDLSIHYKNGAQYMLDTKLSTGQMSGKNVTSIYGSHNTLTRGQAVAFLYRASQMNVTTLADSVRFLAEPPTFKEQDRVLRSYTMGDSIVYHVMHNEDPIANYEVVVTYEDAIIGGYNSIPGADLYGYQIGKPSPTTVPASPTHFQVEPHIDKHKNNEVRAVSYWYNNANYKDIVAKASKLHSSKETENIAQLYADLANEFRAKNGAAALATNSILTMAAKGHSEDMAKRNYFDHDTPEGLSPGDRIDKLANGVYFYSWGENISAGYSSIFSSHTGLINSLGHRDNLLNERFKIIGYGVGYSNESDYKVYYTTKFGTINNQ